ncbi:hypothetical protein HKCCE2091_02985 [Rhodobacterales bacterium HKCCE2091]|nr:hypothetical protein [Rhodobacterales bacterium HKCCE2091]
MQAFAEWIATTGLSRSLAGTGWAVPTLQTIHILAISVLFSAVVMIDLRILGWTGKGQTIGQTLKRFAPWFWGAIVVLACTGALMIVTEPVRELMALSFWIKMVLLAGGIAIAISLHRHVRGNALLYDGEETSPATVRKWAWAVLAVWVAIIFMGRFIAYDPQIWGAWSPIN